ncbi:MAG: asparagine synthase B, partial [Treponema sp.]|nr:asparagine synthase B [Treponema sp.]
MCGFVGVFDLKTQDQPVDQVLKEALRAQVLEMSRKIRHRGPDWSGVYTGDNAILSHERLAIVDPLSGKQPLVSDDNSIILAVNGEIYNHQEIRKAFEGKYSFKTQSDCEVILPLYKKYVESGDFTAMMEELSGIFAFALYDSKRDCYMIGRDEIGVIPLYQGWDKAGRYYVASELKSLEGVCQTIEEFPNGCYLYSGDKGSTPEPVRWYKRDWESYDNVKNNPKATDENGEVINPSIIQKLKDGLETAVKQQLMSDVPYGVLLSGGLDSSIIAAVTQKFSKKRVESGDKAEAWWPQLHSFAVGLEGSPDLEAARKAAEYIGTIHHEVHFTIQEALDALEDVIYHIETYDITTVRASTPMYLLARVIKSMGIKMVLSGEGSDELFGGYLYFHKAPDAKEFHEELVRKMSKLHLYDCLRANKSLSAWGVEGRVPFLDKEFIDIAMRLNPSDKMNIKLAVGKQRMEKWILRKAFEDYLPKEICWRQKEQFSDGVG